MTKVKCFQPIFYFVRFITFFINFSSFFASAFQNFLILILPVRYYLLYLLNLKRPSDYHEFLFCFNMSYIFLSRPIFKPRYYITKLNNLLQFLTKCEIPLENRIRLLFGIFNVYMQRRK